MPSCRATVSALFSHSTWSNSACHSIPALDEARSFDRMTAFYHRQGKGTFLCVCLSFMSKKGNMLFALFPFPQFPEPLRCFCLPLASAFRRQNEQEKSTVTDTFFRLLSFFPSQWDIWSAIQQSYSIGGVRHVPLDLARLFQRSSAS